MVIDEELISILIYLLTAIGLIPGGSSTVHIYTQTIHRKTYRQYEVAAYMYFAIITSCHIL